MIDRAKLAVFRAVERTPPLAVQTPPANNDWTGWLALGGRGSGKTFAMVRLLCDEALFNPTLRARIIGPTLGDVISSCVEGPSGVLANDQTAIFRAAAPGGAMLEWASGATCRLIGTPSPGEVDRLRATGNVELDLFEELAANRMQIQAWEQASLGRRVGRPRWMAATTPRPTPLIRMLANDPNIHVTRGTSHTNPHLPESFREMLDSRLAGTRLYRQEVLGEIIDDIEGALWKQVDLDRSRIGAEQRAVLLPRLKTVVGVDPPSGPGTCGIIVAGADRDGHIYVLADYSVTDVSPNAWAEKVAQARDDFDALVVAEVNQGGRMVTEVLRAADRSIPVTTVNAAQGKQARAEPIALLWEAEHQSAHLAPVADTDLYELEEEMITWIPGTFSPDRVDAMVWAATYLRRGAGFKGQLGVPGRMQREPVQRGIGGNSTRTRHLGQGGKAAQLGQARSRVR